MNVSPFSKNLSFEGAKININAISDTHGKLQHTDALYQTLMENKKDVFEKEEAGCANYLIFGGDWFISGGKKGFLSAPDKPLMQFQAQMLNKFIRQIKSTFPLTKTLFIPGNHEFDGGSKLFSDTIREIDTDVIMSNLDIKKSTALNDAISEKKVVESKIDFIQDDKDPNLKHAVLNLGVAPVNLPYYQQGLDDISLKNNLNIAQKFIQPENYKETMDDIRKKIDEFKKEYPNGTVILTCHTGVAFADNCAAMGDIDLIFDGHEHKNNIRIANGTPIVALSQNFEKLVNAKIELDDEGKKSEVVINELKPLDKKYKEGEISKFYKELFKKDTEKMYAIESAQDGISELSTKNIRSKNSYLANFVTDAILDRIKQRDKSVQIFALNASSIRGGFKLDSGLNVSPFEISNCLDGINPTQSDIYVSEVTGRELALMILDNFLFNNKDTEKNPLIHYSGIEINKTGLMKAHSNGKFCSDFCKYIILKETNEPIDPDKKYKIANPEKYFIKSNNEKIKALKDKSYSINENVHDLFKEFFEVHKRISFTPDIRLY